MANNKSKGEIAVEVTGDSAKLTAELAKASKHLKTFGQEIHQLSEMAKATFGYEIGKIAVEGISKLIEGIKELSVEVGELAVRGDRAKDIAEGFKELGGTSEVLDKASESIHGIMTSTQLMALENKGLLAQGPAFNKFFNDIVLVASKQAHVLGLTVPDAISTLENALIKGDKKGLIPFGISLGNVKRGAETTVKGLGAVKKAAADVEPTADSAGKAFEALNATIADSKDKFGIGINSSDQLRESYRNLIEVINSLDWEEFGKQAAAAASVMLDAFSKVLPYITAGIEKISKFASGGTTAEKLAEVNAKIQNILNGSGGNDSFIELDDQRKKLEAAVQKDIENDLEAQLNAADQLFSTTNSHLKAEDVLKQQLDDKTAKEREKQAKKETKDMQKMQEDLADAQKKAYQDSIDFWESTFENAITGVTFNLEDALKQVAVGFAAQLAASMTGLSFQGGIKGLGVQLAQMLTGGGAGGNSLMNTLGMGSSLLGGTQAGGFIEGLGGTVGPVASGAEYGGMLSGSSLASTVAPAMPYIAAAVGTYMIAKHFGAFDHGPQNPESIARQTAQDKINSMTGRNFDFGATNAFNPGMGGFDQFNSMGTQGKNAFGGLGVALQDLLGITENVGPQIGAILSSQLSGNLDEAKKLTRQLGFSMDDMKAAVIKAGVQMGETWLEIQGKLSGIDDLFTPGLAALGDFNGAFQNIINSGGKGEDALVSVRDAAIEAGEAGITTFDQWAAALKKTFSEKDVNTFFQTLKDMGITNFDQLKNSSDEMAIALVAHLDALQFGFKELKDNVDAATDSINKLNSAASDAADTTSTDTGAVTAHARGGIVNSKTMFGYGGKLGLMGEMGPEAILPLTRVGGKLGVAARLGGSGGGNGITFLIDARGAAPGVEQQIERALNSMRSDIMRDTSKLIQNNTYRNGGTKEWR